MQWKQYNEQYNTKYKPLQIKIQHKTLKTKAMKILKNYTI
jgi:hypothetical protein